LKTTASHKKIIEKKTLLKYKLNNSKALIFDAPCDTWRNSSQKTRENKGGAKPKT
jgi:hypothetical protein